mmetsp:Transcript_1181/g.2381  ORF Transcript_1181/g.2381 Transcript_1181/m.2381 type:complete len:96 (-) Transcript_1181:1480-1767(-)
MTQMESASITVDSRCATMTTVVRLSRIRSARARCTASWDPSSRADVASSNRTIRGLRRNTRAMARRCRCPPEIRPPRSPIRVLYPSFISRMNLWA